MSHFYGTVQGGRGQAHRCGHKTSGLRVSAKTWQREVQTHLYHRDGIDYARVILLSNDAGKPVKVLFDGRLDDYQPGPSMAEPPFSLGEIETAQAEVSPATDR